MAVAAMPVAAQEGSDTGNSGTPQLFAENEGTSQSGNLLGGVAEAPAGTVYWTGDVKKLVDGADTVFDSRSTVLDVKPNKDWKPWDIIVDDKGGSMTKRGNALGAVGYSFATTGAIEDYVDAEGNTHATVSYGDFVTQKVLGNDTSRIWHNLYLTGGLSGDADSHLYLHRVTPPAWRRRRTPACLPLTACI